MTEDFAAGASAARNKLARFLRENGIDVQLSRYGCPPSDRDFLDAILMTLEEGNIRPGSGMAMVLFKWTHSAYQIPVPAAAVDYVRENPERRHVLFSASSTGGSNTLYLAANEDGDVVVHRKKHWRKTYDTETIDTTILQIR